MNDGAVNACIQEINRALSIKFKLLAQLSGLEEDQLERMLDMSAADSDPDPSILIKHSILCGKQYLKF